MSCEFTASQTMESRGFKATDNHEEKQRATHASISNSDGSETEIIHSLPVVFSPRAREFIVRASLLRGL